MLEISIRRNETHMERRGLHRYERKEEIRALYRLISMIIEIRQHQVAEHLIQYFDVWLANGVRIYFYGYSFRGGHTIESRPLETPSFQNYRDRKRDLSTDQSWPFGIEKSLIYF